MAPAIENNNYDQHNLMKCCWFRFWLLIHQNLMMHQIMSVHWLGIFLVNLSISFQCHHQSSTFTLPNLHGHVSRNGALSEVYKMANMMTLMMSLLHPIQPQAYEIGEHSPGNWSERLPTNGGNVSRVDSIQHPRRFFIYIICIPHSFLKRWVLLSSYAQKHIKKKTWWD